MTQKYTSERTAGECVDSCAFLTRQMQAQIDEQIKQVKIGTFNELVKLMGKHKLVDYIDMQKIAESMKGKKP